MHVDEEHVQVAAGDEGAADLPNQSDEDRRWGFGVGDVVQIVQGRSQKRTYALYCGQGRVIHAWTPSRQSFRIRMDSLRGLQRSGYKAAASSTDFDAFFLQLLDLSPLAPADVIRRAKTALHAATASRVSNLSFILFARYGDSIFVLLQSLKKAYNVAFQRWMFGSVPALVGDEGPESPQNLGSPLDDVVRVRKRSDEAYSCVASLSDIEDFLGTNGEHLLSEWLRRSLDEFAGDSNRKNPWFAIFMPAATNCLMPLFLLYDKPSAEFRVRFPAAGSLSERLAGDRMECGVCWMDFTQLKVMVLKCSHYMCDPCLRLLPRRECPYCRAPIRFACEVSEYVKQEACRLMMEAMALEDKAPAPGPQEDDEPPHAEDNNHFAEDPENDGEDQKDS
ncbi:Lecithin retinol acyltransferase [Phytophthora cinnamomi]|uniref:Lecithin retinol acyltransferase n=1 Tax=Phytophthora cinnamomi TaxID=4785 RepID=UPI0035599AE9|nr:Lecithin retinol acyltransferase [Phytophthora cinnamomi]